MAVYVATLGERPSTLFVTPKVEELFGYPRDAWRKDSGFWRQFIHDEDRDAVMQDFTRCIENKEAFVAEYRMTTQSGDTVWVREEAHVAKDRHGHRPFLLGVLQDITREKQTETTLKATCDRARHMVRQRGNRLRSAFRQLRNDIAGRREFQEKNEQLRRTVEKLTSGRDHSELRARARATRIKQVHELIRREAAAGKEAQERARARARIRAERIRQAHSRLRQEIAEAKRLREENDQFRQQLVEFEQAAEELKAHHDRVAELANQRIGELEAANRELRDEVAGSRQAAEELKATCSRLENLTRESADEIEKANEQIQQEAAEHVRVREENEQLRVRLAESQQTAEELRSRRDRLHALEQKLFANVELARLRRRQEISNPGA